MDLSSETSKSIYNIVLKAVQISVKYQNLSLFVRLYQFVKKPVFDINNGIFDILELYGTNILKICIQYNCYELLTHFSLYYNLDIKKWSDQCTESELELINKHCNISESSENKLQYPKFDKQTESFILMRLFVHSLYDLSYTDSLIVYTMYNYFNTEYPSILLNTQLTLSFMKKIYQEDSMQFLIEYKYLNISDVVNYHYLLHKNGSRSNVTIFDFIYNNYIEFKVKHNHYKCSKIKELIKYIIVELYINKYNAVQNYSGFYRDKLIYLLQTYSENIFEVHVINSENDKKLSQIVDTLDTLDTFDKNMFDDEHKHMGIYY